MHSISFVGFLSKIYNLNLILRKHLKAKIKRYSTKLLCQSQKKQGKNEEQSQVGGDKNKQEQNESWILKWKGHWGKNWQNLNKMFN